MARKAMTEIDYSRAYGPGDVMGVEDSLASSYPSLNASHSDPVAPEERLTPEMVAQTTAGTDLTHERIGKMLFDNFYDANPALQNFDPPEHRKTLSWHGVSYTLNAVARRHAILPNKMAKKQILYGVSGYVCPGEILAIMGPTGSGKSTLLNALARRIVTGVTGHILCNGRPLDHRWKYQSSYVLQDDIMFPFYTVRQTLLFQARMRARCGVPDVENVAHVNALMRLLNLERCADTIIGNNLVRGVSGGERKRVNIGIQLITGAGIMFLDEPTSGLDTSTAQQVIGLLKRLAAADYTIITTIHQPPNDVFKMFDRLLLLIDGRAVYFGSATEAHDYFARFGIRQLGDWNPADAVMEAVLALRQNRDEPQHAKQFVSFLITEWRKREAGAVPRPNAVLEMLGDSALPPLGGATDDRLLAALERGGADAAAKGGHHDAPMLCRRFTLLARRSIFSNVTTYFNLVSIVQTLFISLIFGLIWLGTPRLDNQIHNRAGGIFFMLLFAGSFNPVLQVLYSFPMERPFIIRELNEGAYPISTYFLAKTISEMPFEQIYPLIFLLITYWMVGFDPKVTSFLLTWLVFMFLTWTSSGLGYVISSIFYNIRITAMLATVILLSMILTSGFYIEYMYIPKWISWIGYFSYIKYAFDAMLGLEIGYDNPALIATFTPFIKSYVANLFVLFFFMVGFRIIAYFCLRAFFVPKK